MVEGMVEVVEGLVKAEVEAEATLIGDVAKVAVVKVVEVD